MPLHDYRCPTCKVTTEDSLNTVEHCPVCGRQMEQLIGRAQFLILGFSAKNGYSKENK